MVQSGMRSRSRDRSCSQSESTTSAGVGIGAEVGKIYPTPTPTRSLSLAPGPAGDDLERMVGHGHVPENIKIQEEKEGGSVQLKLKRLLVI